MASTAFAPPDDGRTDTSRGVRSARWIPALCYVALAATFWPRFHYIQWKDEINWITIAERYARGAWDIAPNAFWPPLVSWLEAIPIALGVPSVVAAKLVSLAIGLIAGWSFSRLLRALHVPPAPQLAFLLVMVPCLVYFAYFASGADLLLAALISLYVSITMRPPGSRGLRHALACGALGSLMYFCKGYALYFFVAHYACVSLADLWSAAGRPGRLAVIKHGLATLVILATTIAPWVGMVHAKYGFTTLGIIGSYNFAMRSPDSPDAPPTTYLGLIAPPPEVTVSVWEEPIYLARQLPSWSPFDSPRARSHQVWLMKQAGLVTLQSLYEFTPFWIVILIGAALLWAVPIARGVRWPVGVALLTIALYPAGYLIIHMEARYLWPVHFLLVALTALLTQYLPATPWLRQRAMRWLVPAVLLAAFLVLPVQKLLEPNVRGESLESVRRAVAADGMLKSTRVASSGDYAASVLVAYHVGAKYYGQPSPNESAAKIEADLVRLGVQYYFVWDGATVDSAILRPYKQFKSEGLALKIYSVRPPAS